MKGEEHYSEEANEHPERSMGDRLKSMTASLLRTRNEAVEFRSASGVERQWSEDEMLFAGVDITVPGKGRMIDYATGDSSDSRGGGAKARRSKVVVNIVRPKCEIAEGRFSDILLPVDDRNWGLKTTPDPEIDQMLKDPRPATQEGNLVTKQDGSPATMREVGQDKISSANEKMELMEREIDDQLNECGFNGECRKAIRSAVRRGTGVLKGPEVIKRVKSKWDKVTDETGTAFVVQQEEDERPASRCCDIWDIYPDPGCDEDIRKATYCWERGTILPRELRKLIGVNGYYEDQIKLVLEEDPRRLSVAIDKSTHRVKNNVASRGQAYETWEYNGDVSKDDLLEAGCDCEFGAESITASVLFVNDRPVKVALNTLEGTTDLPYDFFTWSPVPGSVWGVGVARESMWQQRVITAAWRAMMDNAGDSSGANVVVGDGIEPMDGIYEVTGKKLWKATQDGEVVDVRKAFGQFQIANNQAELEAIINLSLRFLDQETSIPTLFNGEAKTAPETLGATNIMVDANNVGLRTKVKLWDDSVTRPHLSRYYTWNMLHSDNDECKGDYSVDPRGTSILFEKDQRAQSLLQSYSLKGDPDIAKSVDWDRWTRLYFQSVHLDVMKDKEQIKAEAQEQQPGQAQPSPQMEVARIRVEGALKEEEMRQQSDMAELQFKAAEAVKNREHQMAMRQMEKDIEIMKMSQNNGVAIDRIKAQLAMNAGKIDLQRELSSGQGKGSQVIEPVAEPPQHAPDGRAFQE